PDRTQALPTYRSLRPPERALRDRHVRTALRAVRGRRVQAHRTAVDGDPRAPRHLAPGRGDGQDDGGRAEVGDPLRQPRYAHGTVGHALLLLPLGPEAHRSLVAAVRTALG